MTIGHWKMSKQMAIFMHFMTWKDYTLAASGLLRNNKNMAPR